jgi:hypothetical protein
VEAGITVFSALGVAILNDINKNNYFDSFEASEYIPQPNMNRFVDNVADL